MSGIKDLEEILSSLSPVLGEESYVFCTVDAAYDWSPLRLKLRGMFVEKEGVTLILPVEVAAEAGLEGEGGFRCITLNVHSSLEAVGLTAVFSTALTKAGLSANVVAGYYHDHIFVGCVDAERALATLQQLAVKE